MTLPEVTNGRGPFLHAIEASQPDESAREQMSVPVTERFARLVFPGGSVSVNDRALEESTDD